MIRDIVSQHAEEAADLWSRRHEFFSQPERTFRDLERYDERIEAHVDGLRIAGPAASAVCDEILSGDSAGEIFARFMWAASTEQAQYLTQVIARARDSFKLAEGISGALAWLQFPGAQHYIDHFLREDFPALKVAGIRGCTAHQYHPVVGLRPAMLSDSEPLSSCALRAAGEVGAIEDLDVVISQLSSEDLSAQFWAARSTSLMCFHTGALNVLRTAIEMGLMIHESALELAIGRMENEAARSWIQDLLNGIQVRQGVIGIGMLGDPADMPRLLEIMEKKPLTRLAGSAFRMITGLDIRREYLDRPAPESDLSEAKGDDEEAEPVADPDQDLPWPDVEKVRARWLRIKKHYVSGVRYLFGRPFSRDAFLHVLSHGRQRERGRAALELSLQQPGESLFDCFSPAFRQRTRLR